MNRQQFEYYLREPSGLSSTQLPDLDDLAGAFPYCQTLHVMIAMIYAQDESIHFQSYLRQAAAYAADRKRLRQMIMGRLDMGMAEGINHWHPLPEPAQQAVHMQEHVEEDPDTIPGFERFHQLVVELEQAILELRVKKEQPYTAYDVGNELGEIGESAPKSDGEDAAAPLDSLLKQFLHNGSREAQPKATFFDAMDLARKSVIVHEDIASETLAQICVDQGHYQRAVKIYQQLILKFPEKSSYFAAQIEKLEKETGKS